MNGISLAFITALISGVSIFANSLFVQKTDPVLFAAVRNAAVACILAVWILVSGKLSVFASLSRSAWIKLLLIGIIGGGLPFALFFLGLSKTGAVPGNLIHKTMFAWVALLAIPMLKEKLTWVQIIGYITVFFALFGLSGSGLPSFADGSFLVLAATMLWSVEHIIARKVLKGPIDASIVSLARMVFGLPFLIGYVLIAKIPVTSAVFGFPVLVSAGFLTMYMLAWYSAIRKAQVTAVSSVLVAAPAVTMFLQATFRGKSVAQSELLQMAVLIGGVAVILIPFIRRTLVRSNST